MGFHLQADRAAWVDEEYEASAPWVLRRELGWPRW